MRLSWRQFIDVGGKGEAVRSLTRGPDVREAPRGSSREHLPAFVHAKNANPKTDTVVRSQGFGVSVASGTCKSGVHQSMRAQQRR